MKILVDENIPLSTVEALRAMQHDILDLRSTTQEGAPDETLWHISDIEQRLLITTDKGFARRVSRPHSGLLIITLRQPNRQKIHERILLALSQVEAQGWRNRTVLMRDTVQTTRYFHNG
jgi:predicted nuclease of predicted toxin-antitoxin system